MFAELEMYKDKIFRFWCLFRDTKHDDISEFVNYFVYNCFIFVGVFHLILRANFSIHFSSFLTI